MSRLSTGQIEFATEGEFHVATWRSEAMGVRRELSRIRPALVPDAKDYEEWRNMIVQLYIISVSKSLNLPSDAITAEIVHEGKLN